MRGYSQSIALLVIISRISNDLRYKNVFLLRSKEKNVVNLLTPTHYIETISNSSGVFRIKYTLKRDSRVNQTLCQCCTVIPGTTLYSRYHYCHQHKT